MNETITTIVGNVVDTPSQRTLESGVSVTSFRVASTARRFDRVTNRWADGGSLFLKVTCWRSLAENTAACVVKGDPVVVTGRLYTRTYEVAESRRASYELEATAVGFDLNRGRGTFKRVSSSRAVTVDDLGPDGIPTGGAVDAHIESGMPAADGAVETDALDDDPLDEADDDAADSAGTAFEHASTTRPVDTAANHPTAPGRPADGTGGRAADEAAPSGAAEHGDVAGRTTSGSDGTTARGSTAPGNTALGNTAVPKTPRPPARRHGASPVPA